MAKADCSTINAEGAISKCQLIHYCATGSGII